MMLASALALVEDAAVSEDGIVVNKDALTKLSFKPYERQAVEFGSKAYPLNMYGTNKQEPFKE